MVTTPLHIAVLGAGAMGCYFAARLAEASHDVTLIDVDDRRLAALDAGGVRIRDDRGDRRVAVRARRAEAVDRPADLILLFTKGMHSAVAMRSVAHLLAEQTCVLSLQNGLGNAEAMAAVAPPDRILLGVTDVPADLVDATTVESHGAGRIRLGAWRGDRMLAEPVVAALRSAGLDAAAHPAVEAAVWEKIAFNAAINAVATVTGLTVGQLAAPPARRLIDAASREALDVAAALGIPVDRAQVAGKIAFAIANHGDHQPSMLQDRIAGRPTEIETINGAIVRAGAGAGVPTPVNALLADIVRAIEQSPSKGPDIVKTIDLLIANADVAADGAASFDRVGPVSDAVATRAAAASPDDARRAADAAAAAFPAWKALGPNARRDLLLKAAAEIERAAPVFIAAMAEETGAAPSWAGFNVHLAGAMLREAAALTTQVTGEVIPSDRPGCLAMAVRQPAGVVLGIAPWNAPVILGVRAIATPLACGNTVVLKASELCPHTHWLIGDAFRRAGFPDGVVNVVTNAPDDAPAVVEALVRHRRVRRVNFTGSTGVGRVIARLCADELKPALFELGGKAPMIVLDDADIDEAVAAAAFGAFFNSGQICMSTERIILQGAAAEPFMTKFKAKVATLAAADPRTTPAPLGAVADRRAIDTIARLIADARDRGADIFQPQESDGAILAATVVDGVTPDMAIYAEESFGPVVAVLRVATEDEAVALANDTDYGLTSAVFTGDAARGLRIAERLDAGMCHINGPTVHDEAQMPFGGMKDSGYGRFGGRAGIAEFTDLRWVTIDTQPGHFPI